MQKALKWLNANELAYEFHNYKEEGIDKATLEVWLQHFPTDKLVNLKSTTYKNLTDEEKAGVANKAKAIKLMIAQPSIIKRPFWDLGNGQFFLGWNEPELTKLLIR